MGDRAVRAMLPPVMRCPFDVGYAAGLWCRERLENLLGRGILR